jgi:hypothetical protein
VDRRKYSSDPGWKRYLVARDSLDGNEIGKEWNDPEFLARAKSARPKKNSNGHGDAHGETASTRPPSRVIGAGTFMRGYEPISYLACEIAFLARSSALPHGSKHFALLSKSFSRKQFRLQRDIVFLPLPEHRWQRPSVNFAWLANLTFW